jgi:hypothetical protein
MIDEFNTVSLDERNNLGYHSITNVRGNYSLTDFTCYGSAQHIYVGKYYLADSRRTIRNASPSYTIGFSPISSFSRQSVYAVVLVNLDHMPSANSRDSNPGPVSQSRDFGIKKRP